MSRLPPAVLLLAALSACGCGYHVSGHADLMPKTVKTIAVVPFSNATTRARLPQSLAAALSHELISRTRYQVVGDPEAADAILYGSIINLNAFPTVVDPVSGRSTGVQVTVLLSVQLDERSTGKTLFVRPVLEVRERYEISIDQFAYFEERAPAMERWSRDVARAVVSAILEQF
jgi:hypothetical protein